MQYKAFKIFQKLYATKSLSTDEVLRQSNCTAKVIALPVKMPVSTTMEMFVAMLWVNRLGLGSDELPKSAFLKSLIGILPTNGT